MYKISGDCASVVTDVLYDESKIGLSDGPPPILSISISVICKTETPEKLGTFTFELIVSKKIQQQINAADYTIIGDLSIQFWQSPEQFSQYIRDGILSDTVIKVVPIEGDTAQWYPFLRTKNEGVFMVFGELVDLGKKLKAEP
ncbi:MAG: hypothetical protein ABUK01_13015 [Leptospirales bacterium]